jgi:hypothetical protein
MPTACGRWPATRSDPPFVPAFPPLVKCRFAPAAAAARLPREEAVMRNRAALGVLVLVVGVAEAAEGPGIAYPDGYRRWAHVKTTIVGPASPAFALNGGIHQFYANEKAVEGYASGRFPDGSVLIDDGLEPVEAKGVTSAGTRKRLAVMAKDAARNPETGGWGFEVFRGDGRTASLTGPERAACFACHTKSPRDAVFSELGP